MYSRVDQAELGRTDVNSSDQHVTVFLFYILSNFPRSCQRRYGPPKDQTKAFLQGTDRLKVYVSIKIINTELRLSQNVSVLRTFPLPSKRLSSLALISLQQRSKRPAFFCLEANFFPIRGRLYFVRKFEIIAWERERA